MSSDLLRDPLKPSNGLTLTPVHILALALCSVSLIFTNLLSPNPLSGPLTRLSILLILLLLSHHFILYLLSHHSASLANAHEEEKARIDPLVKSKLEQKKSDWEYPDAHPSHFLTTKEGKPRLFPFPLGLAGGGESKELWWEAGNSSHIGHYNQRETPAAREQLKAEMEAKESARQKRAKKAIKEFETARKKWTTRLTNLKVLMSIISVGLVSKKVAVGCLMAWIYYIVVGYLTGLLAVPKDDEEKPAKERKKIPTTPGMAITYLYEPDGNSVKPTGNIPTRAPSHRLTTTYDSRYAS
ncbi:hypothetical protein C343_02870 [Cryptococcus neoformans C23]|uniref:Uncharacterized protein n=1 Tax=Cryptococcus neoformans (strain H99 / ATCC 208821 / CBS 10515 / FGSC 9487) TaxID=235443 RepID=J9VST4_CRYN9|nr:hypothetical protein CNAG_01358 [Cryptococcus neoformans var. grubii H99]AUB24496.1 hypothetical protein CKF44_01358 [Cryptococcus neoformans var. grubii]OWZ32239.1 hypothetical protein C347_02933 [Cryptococcus neoformans var. grubii AD2-60a]OWZ44086.1 hypothetical protein C343_02870 [Cryptococcus neoformans var. grubii C23]OWZ45067.1 hypothetical protein C353_02771 [Cryptococcus neoformans var. grubii AD1-83a]OWZ58391.1 hypothetical protein C368_00553 [Cryptococcus neoformans var. grubii 1|eukprot:XP_012048960.1 hypothetical protein CNAG_01358 [Cryptococcus neoformans var. grubii H99]